MFLALIPALIGKYDSTIPPPPKMAFSVKISQKIEFKFWNREF